MPRATITNRKLDLNSDNGAILWSIIQGEQFESMLTFKYLEDIEDIIFKAVLIEAANVALTEDDDAVVPSTVQASGKQNTLVMRKPVIVPWDIGNQYQIAELVSYDSKYYSCIDTPPVGTLPTDIMYYSEYNNNKVFLQFTKELSVNWTIAPQPKFPVYGFIEIAITDSNVLFAQTLKSIRGMVEFVFSPTQLVV